jgi:hypothetical protein
MAQIVELQMRYLSQTYSLHETVSFVTDAGCPAWHTAVASAGTKACPAAHWDKVVQPAFSTAVRLKVEENQLVDIFSEIGIHIDGLKGR